MQMPKIVLGRRPELKSQYKKNAQYAAFRVYALEDRKENQVWHKFTKTWAGLLRWCIDVTLQDGSVVRLANLYQTRDYGYGDTSYTVIELEITHAGNDVNTIKECLGFKVNPNEFRLYRSC